MFFQGSQMKTVVPRIVVSNMCRFCEERRDPSLTRKPKGKEGHNIERGGHFQSTHPSKLIWVTMFLCSFFLMSTIVRQNPADWPRLVRPSSDWTHTGFFGQRAILVQGLLFFLDFHILCLFALARAARPDHVPKPNNGSLHLPHGL